MKILCAVLLAMCVGMGGYIVRLHEELGEYDNALGVCHAAFREAVGNYVIARRMLEKEHGEHARTKEQCAYKTQLYNESIEESLDQERMLREQLSLAAQTN